MNANDHAFPFATEQTMKYHSGTKEGEMGMTIRTYIATKAMAAMISAGSLDSAAAQGIDPDTNAKALVSAAIILADALIAELSKS